MSIEIFNRDTNLLIILSSELINNLLSVEPYGISSVKITAKTKDAAKEVGDICKAVGFEVLASLFEFGAYVTVRDVEYKINF